MRPWWMGKGVTHSTDASKVRNIKKILERRRRKGKVQSPLPSVPCTHHQHYPPDLSQHGHSLILRLLGKRWCPQGLGGGSESSSDGMLQ